MVGRGDKTGTEGVMVTTLGTGAALPSRYRNVSSTLIWLPPNDSNLPDGGAILLDAGEGTYGQLYRRFNNAEDLKLEDVLLNLTFIFVSHMHADHHIGIIRLLLQRKELCEKLGIQPKPLCIVGPPHYYTWLHEYADVEDLGLGGGTGIEFVQCQSIVAGTRGLANIVLDRYVKLRIEFEYLNFVTTHMFGFSSLKTRLGLTSIETLSVEHSSYAYALSLKHSSGWKIVYSGDCRPSVPLIQLGSDADLLIHEATFENDLHKEAVDKKHSTTSEAMKVGGRMRAKWVLLTHFSQRYPKIPRVEGGGLPDDV
ncbi:Zinc phosphodiesterase ELAC protein 2, partial [Rhizophlyctis rosea]